MGYLTISVLGKLLAVLISLFGSCMLCTYQYMNTVHFMQTCPNIAMHVADLCHLIAATVEV